MKIIKMIFFILIALKLEAQSETPKFEQRHWYVKPYWDLHLGIVITNHETYKAGVLVGMNARFRNHLYTSLNYMLAGDLLFPESSIFGSESNIIQNLSLVTGVHHTNKYFYGAIGFGISRLKGNYWDSKLVAYNSFKVLGLEFKAETSLIINRYSSFGFSYNYNLNHRENLKYIMLDFHFNLIP